MKRLSRLSTALLPRSAILFTSLAACSSAPPSFVQSAEAQDVLVVYRGFPRDTSEAPARDEPTMMIGDQKFYTGQHRATGGDARALAKALADSSVYTSHVSGNKCGGFHADYAVEWPGDQGPLRVLLCFGCNEARAIEGNDVAVTDLTDDGESRLEPLLTKVTGP